MLPNKTAAYPSLNIERALWTNGALWVAGIDEAGRGALAGPVSAAAVILPQIHDLSNELHGVQDSKLMTAETREIWSQRIKEKAVAFGVSTASCDEIDQYGILPATKLAAWRAINQLAVVPSYLLIDHFKLEHLNLPQISLPKCDMISLSVAAASILAKTFRDQILTELESMYPGYGFAEHKGYGTAAHRKAIESIGPSPEHRKSFEPVKSYLNRM
jgi:ribonuclease HII